jgi:cytochrome P450
VASPRLQPVQQIFGESGWTSSPLANPNTRGAFGAVDRDILRSNILFTDGVDHQRLRDSVRDVFTHSFIAGLVYRRRPEPRTRHVVTTAVIIAVAGHETTANLLGAAMIRLLKPGANGVLPVDTIDTVDDRLISELLRLDGPLQAVGRTATRDQILGGVAICAGEPAVAAIGAANRDPEVFSWPRRLEIDRPGPAPLTFGYGPHRL